MNAAVFPYLALVAGYLLGSIAFAVLVSRAMGLSDPRTYGSGNPGATNVLRSGNRAAAILTLVLDAAKGAVPVLVARLVGRRLGLDADAVEWAAVLAGFGAFLGHLWPVFFRFAGGKGVATALGVLLALDPLLGAATFATWLVIAFFFRYSSLASLVAAAFAPFWHALVWGPSATTLVIAFMSALLAWRHEANIGRLLAGTESKFGQKAKPNAKRA